MLGGEASPYATQAVSMKVVMHRYLMNRLLLEKLIRTKVFLPIAVRHGFVQRTQAELDHKVYGSEKKYILPKFFYTQRLNLLSSTAEQEMLLRLRDKGEIPAEIVCVAPETRIFLKNGNTLPIKDVKIGDEVITHTGKTRKVLKVFNREISEEICKLQTFFAGDPLLVTKNHPIFLVPRALVFKKRVNELAKYFTKPIIKPIGELEEETEMPICPYSHN